MWFGGFGVYCGGCFVCLVSWFRVVCAGFKVVGCLVSVCRLTLLQV